MIIPNQSHSPLILLWVDGSSAIEVYTALTGTSQMLINGTGVYDESSNPAEGFYPIAETTISTLELSGAQASQAAYIYGFKVGGKLLVDSGKGGIAGAVGNTLSQTWLEWNDVSADLRADNPADVAIYNAIETAFETYEGDCAECRQEVINSLVKIVASGILTNDEEEHLAKFMRSLIH